MKQLWILPSRVESGSSLVHQEQHLLADSFGPTFQLLVLKLFSGAASIVTCEALPSSNHKAAITIFRLELSSDLALIHCMPCIAYWISSKWGEGGEVRAYPGPANTRKTS
ncbi:uncharacterized protein MEPE_03495 [Melanopsichium pennsylvanicum]|uniref:Uncharacterized protein n=1 Tax=Melanopsichium pennsylvanicum TaxID=63383 RepID=A0AAJ4XMU2_9BASI|nr:uncharacterized protein MEPE_03495 [Melanopsichium pennsylvanicum]